MNGDDNEYMYDYDKLMYIHQRYKEKWKSRAI